MQTKLLTKLLEDVTEINISGDYYAGFRYAVDKYGAETLALDLFKGGTSYYHKVITNNNELDEAIVEFRDVTRSKTKWNIYYCDDYMSIDENLPSEPLAASKAFMLKQKYNLDVTITELLDESL